ncbi:MAG: hypothetical protein IJA79_00610 [Desulfovibrio sp.]|nr:hypothetical protein [Desulfovibrio sp.]
MNIFQKAIKEKLLFESGAGMISVVDLYSLPLTSNNPAKPSLDDMALAVYRRIKEKDEISFVTKQEKDTTLEMDKLRLEVLKAVIDDKLADQEKARQDRAKAELREKLMALKVRKEDANLESMSIEEIDKALAELK